VNRRWLRAGAGASGLALIACIELSAPQSGLSAISPIETAWPSVVLGDRLRDSLGEIAPLRVEAFDADGKPIENPEIHFIVLDRGLHLETGAVVVGDSIRTTTPARVVAQVRVGTSVLQTPEDSIDIVPRPDSIAPAADTTFGAKEFQLSTLATVASDGLQIKVMSRDPGGGAPQPVRSWIVRYEIVAEPPGVNGQRTALFTGAGTARVVRDTTDANGLANGRTITLQPEQLTSFQGDQVVEVRATVWRVGAGAGTSILIRVPFRPR
jgi:hypothetical protein